MSPIIHALGSWLVATATTTNPRDRLLVTLAGVVPDADGLGILVDTASSLVSGRENTFHYYQQYHHYLLHGWPAALVVAGLLACFGRQRIRVLLICLVAFHLHLLCDLLGSRGPTPGDLWPIAYGEPFFRHPVFFWKGQWRLDGWQNRVICVTIFVLELSLVPRRGNSVVGIFSRKADAVFVEVLRKWRCQLRQRAS
ncbi:MAG TPA: metal-dependent hydrolase [Candidatus Paceibacterota bacterium]|nr:metal-dependent hydrolase [Candidatus Paceibacterota bacterium]